MGSPSAIDLEQRRLSRHPPPELGYQGMLSLTTPHPMGSPNNTQTNFSQPFFTFWDRFLGTVWTGGDISARYERSKIAAQRLVDQASPITNTAQSQSNTSNPKPYQDALTEAKELYITPLSLQQPQPPNGKATQQAAASREQVLDDYDDGGRQILLEEAAEEKEARSMIRKSNRRRTASSLTQSESLRGLRERVTMHGRTGGILGMESSR